MDKVQEEAPLGESTSSEGAVEEDSVPVPPNNNTDPEAENPGKFTLSNVILMVSPTPHFLVLLRWYVI